MFRAVLVLLAAFSFIELAQAEPAAVMPGTILDQIGTSPGALQRFWELDPAIRNFVGLTND